SVAFGQAEAVIAYGSERAIQQIRGRVPPTVRFVPYGHKLSFGAIGREALESERCADTVDRAAYDVAKYDQQGCLSPHLFYVEPIDDLVADVPRLARDVRRYLQTCGVAANARRVRALAEGLGRLGLDRVCPLGRMGDVAPNWHHDGRFTLLELLRWTDLEPD